MAQRQFISIKIGDEEYGVEITAIREIKGWAATTALPDSPLHMRGVINLRGTIVPILDLRTRFGGSLTEASPRHVIMVVAVRDQMAGILVDAVADILSVTDDDIQPVPQLNQHSGEGFLTGLVTVEGRMVALLDLDRVYDFDPAAVSAVAAA